MSSGVLLAQGAARGDWSMTGGDVGQNGWQKAESKLTKDNAAGSFKYLWKIKLGQGSKGGTSFSEPLLASRLINGQGFKDIVFWSSGDTLYGVDSELGSELWKKKFDVKPSMGKCASSSLGMTMEAPFVINFNARRAPATPAPVQHSPLAPSERRLGVAPGGGGFSLKGIYVLTPDGMLHEQVVTTGADFAAPVKFLPGAKASNGINIMGRSIYATTGSGCADTPNGVWAIDMTSDSYPVVSYGTQRVKPISLTGPVISPDGTAYVVTGAGTSDAAAGIYAGSIVALGKDLKAKDWYTPTGSMGAIENVSPITFAFKGKQMLLAPGKDGSLVLLDTTSLGGADHHTPLYETAAVAKAGEKHSWDGFASEQDKAGTTWVFASISAGLSAQSGAKMNGAATHGGIMAFKVEDADGRTTLMPVWTSRDMVNPAPPRIANGVVVALAGGNASTHAMLYVLDATTGDELYTSKDAIPTYTHFSGVAFGDSHAFFTDHDNVLYSFGIALEH
jgi:outer membrane protein assembly factor BamB